MKSLFKAGATVSVGLLLSTSAVNAASIRPQTQKLPRNQVSLEREFTGFKNQIKYLGKTLSLSQAQQKQISTPIEVPKAAAMGEISQLFPANTPYLIFVNTQAKKWQQLSRFHVYSMAEKAIAQFAPEGINFDYKRDVESWLGEQVVLGFLPKRGENLATLESSYIAIAPIRDQSRIDTFVAFLSSDSKRVKTREYKGVKIYEITTPNISSPQDAPKPTQPVPKALPNETLTKVLGGAQSRTIAVAALPGYLLGGLSGNAIEQVIDNYQGNGQNISKNSNFQEFWQQSQQNEILVSAYQNPLETIKLYQDFFKDPKFGLGTVELPQFIQDLINPEKYQKYRHAQFLVKLQPEGIRMQAAIHTNPTVTNKQLKTTEKLPIPLVGRMPGTTYTTLTSSNFSLQWQAITSLIGSVKEFQQGLTGFREFVRTSTGLDFEREIIGWIDSDYGLFSFPTKGGFLNKLIPGFNLNLGLGFIAETKQPEVAKKTLTKLEELIQSVSGGSVKIKNVDIKGQPVISWELENKQSVFAYSWLEPNSIMISTGAGAIAELIPAPRSPLNSAYNFTTATNSLPKPNQGYFYVNMGSFLSWSYGFVPQEFQNNEYFRVFKEAIGSVYSISSTSSQITNGEQFDFLMVLAPNRTNSPILPPK